MIGTVRQTLDPDGMIYIDGALWQATANADDPDSTPTIHERVPVTVTAIDGLRLFVRRATAEEAERAGVVVMGDQRPVIPDAKTRACRRRSSQSDNDSPLTAALEYLT